MQYVIVGGSIAAASAIKSIRANDSEGSLTVVSQEKPFYYRPMIPLIVDGSISETDITFSDDFIGTLGIEVVSDQAVSLAPGKKELMLASGNKLKYEKLLIATGSRPLLPNIPGVENAFTLRTLEDANKINEAAGRAKQAAILGGGLVGIKAALALSKQGLHATIVEKLAQILYPRLDQKGAAIVQTRLEQKGIRVITNDSFSAVLPNGAKLTSGAVVDADIVVLAAGTCPNTDWLDGSGVNIEQAVVVDENMKTSVEDCYAAGDVVQGLELLEQQPAVSALWTHAVDMGKAAGTNMVGGKRCYPGFLSVMNATEIEGIPMISAGSVADESGEVVAANGHDAYRKLVFRDDRLIGAIFMGRITHAGIYINLIKNQLSLGKLKDKTLKGKLSYADFMPAA